MPLGGRIGMVKPTVSSNSGNSRFFHFCSMLRVGGKSDKIVPFLGIGLEVVKAIFEQRT
jgi:hypothetical protein